MAVTNPDSTAPSKANIHYKKFLLLFIINELIKLIYFPLLCIYGIHQIISKNTFV